LEKETKEKAGQAPGQEGAKGEEEEGSGGAPATGGKDPGRRSGEDHRPALVERPTGVGTSCMWRHPQFPTPAERAAGAEEEEEAPATGGQGGETEGEEWTPKEEAFL
jgi:hypothetical protein